MYVETRQEGEVVRNGEWREAGGKVFNRENMAVKGPGGGGGNAWGWTKYKLRV